MGAVAAAASLTSDGAQAGWERHHGFDCTTNDAFSDSAGVISNFGSQQIGVNCALDDTNLSRKGDIDLIRVHGYKASGWAATSAKVCISYWGAYGGSCGNSAATNGTGGGLYGLEPPLTALSGSAADFGYLNVQLPVNSQLFGYYVVE